MSLKIGRNDPCWCGSGKKYKKCHEAFDVKVEMLRQEGYPVLDHNLIKTPEQIEKIKESCRINIAVLDYVAEHTGGVREISIIYSRNIYVYNVTILEDLILGRNSVADNLVDRGAYALGKTFVI